ncbi:MAG: hypothetical protein Q4F65_12185 [Propionibacteriaceae bacterium]|nr:hypothetical protein [Propionibacteriaceae bacterium]
MTKPPPEHTPQSGAPAGNAGVRTVLATYLAALLLGGVGVLIGVNVPCEGFLCSITGGMVGALVGVLFSAPVAAYVARRDGVAWWYTPIAYGIPVAVLAALLGVSPLAQHVPELSLWLLMAAGPLVAIALAGRMPGWARVALVAIVVAAVVVVPLLAQQWREARRADERRDEASRWRQEGVPLLAPVSREGVQVHSIGVSAREGGGHEAFYDLTQPGLEGEARVWLETGPDAESRCEGRNATDLGDGVSALGPDSATTACRTIDGVKVSVWQDGAQGSWRGTELVDLARDLQRTDGSWLEQHLT